MTGYVLRRLLYSIPILLGVNAVTFALFFVVNPPEMMARRILGEKTVTPQQVQNWLRDRQYHLPLFVNVAAGPTRALTETVFFKKSISLIWFEFGKSDRNNIDIGDQIRRRMWPSLSVTVPIFILSLFAYVTAAMLIAYVRGTYADTWAVIACVILMSISTLFYIIGGQWVLGKLMCLAPMSGYDTGLHAVKFVALPVLIGIVSGIGASTRFYRMIFLEELGQDYIRTARAKGISEERVLFKHALLNAMIPILTNVVATIPFLFMGSLLFESFFAIPGLGSFMIEAIHAQDFAIVRSMVFLGAVLYVLALLATDVSYTLVDPRVRLE